MLGDKHTLLVQYRDDKKDCIECKKCVRVCHMGIDIREGPFQIQCVHCGECIDACDEILGRLKQPKEGLIRYTWGESGAVVETERRWYRRLGIRDAKRVVILAITLLYLERAVGGALHASRGSGTLAPERATLYRVDDSRNGLQQPWVAYRAPQRAAGAGDDHDRRPAGAACAAATKPSAADGRRGGTAIEIAARRFREPTTSIISVWW